MSRAQQHCPAMLYLAKCMRMSPIGTCVSTLCPQLVALFGGCLGGMASLEDRCYWTLALVVSRLSFQFALSASRLHLKM